MRDLPVSERADVGRVGRGSSSPPPPSPSWASERREG